MKAILHNYFRSSASFRVRIALNVKGIEYEYRSYHLRKGEQKDSGFLALNPHGLVPAFELESGELLTQSLAIIEYLDEVKPHPALLPPDPFGKAYVRSLSHSIAMDLHPVNNLRILAYLREKFQAGENDVKAWVQNWAYATFEAFELQLQRGGLAGKFCYMDQPTIADICLVPQYFNNQRFEVDNSRFPTIKRIVEACLENAAFKEATPSKQPDAEA